MTYKGNIYKELNVFAYMRLCPCRGVRQCMLYRDILSEYSERERCVKEITTIDSEKSNWATLCGHCQQ